MLQLLADRQGGGNFSSVKRTIAYHKANVGKLRISQELAGHQGCVNALEWSSEGNYLLSSSDDCRILRWSFPSWKLSSVHQTGHTGNVFCLRYIPHHEQFVASSAADGSVRLSHLERGASMQIIGHKGIVHKFVTIPSAPTVLYSCSSDGTVRMYDIRTKCRDAYTVVDNTWSKFKRALMSIALEPVHHLHFAVGGAEGIVKVYDRRMVSRNCHTCEHRQQSPGLVRQLSPAHLQTLRKPLTSVVYSHDGRQLLCSYSGEYIYLFQQDKSALSWDPALHAADAEVLPDATADSWASTQNDLPSTSEPSAQQITTYHSSLGPALLSQPLSLQQASPTPSQLPSESSYLHHVGHDHEPSVLYRSRAHYQPILAPRLHSINAAGQAILLHNAFLPSTPADTDVSHSFRHLLGGFTNPAASVTIPQPPESPASRPGQSSLMYQPLVSDHGFRAALPGSSIATGTTHASSITSVTNTSSPSNTSSTANVTNTAEDETQTHRQHSTPGCSGSSSSSSCTSGHSVDKQSCKGHQPPLQQHGSRLLQMLRRTGPLNNPTVSQPEPAHRSNSISAMSQAPKQGPDKPQGTQTMTSGTSTLEACRQISDTTTPENPHVNAFDSAQPGSSLLRILCQSIPRLAPASSRRPSPWPAGSNQDIQIRSCSSTSFHSSQLGTSKQLPTTQQDASSLPDIMHAAAPASASRQPAVQHPAIQQLLHTVKAEVPLHRRVPLSAASHSMWQMLSGGFRMCRDESSQLDTSVNQGPQTFASTSSTRLQQGRGNGSDNSSSDSGNPSDQSAAPAPRERESESALQLQASQAAASTSRQCNSYLGDSSFPAPRGTSQPGSAQPRDQESLAPVGTVNQLSAAPSQQSSPRTPSAQIIPSQHQPPPLLPSQHLLSGVVSHMLSNSQLISDEASSSRPPHGPEQAVPQPGTITHAARPVPQAGINSALSILLARLADSPASSHPAASLPLDIPRSHPGPGLQSDPHCTTPGAVGNSLLAQEASHTSSGIQHTDPDPFPPADTHTDFSPAKESLAFPELDWAAVAHLSTSTAPLPRITLSRWQSHWRHMSEMVSLESNCSRSGCVFGHTSRHMQAVVSVEEGDNTADGMPCCFKGHRNIRTIKDVAFFGSDSQYVMSGSDDGRIFMWCAQTGQLVLMQQADGRVVNCFAQHPSSCCFVSAGGDHAVKVWMPEAEGVDDLAEAERVMQSNEHILANPSLGINLPLEVIRAMLGLRYRAQPLDVTLAQATNLNR